MTNIKVSVIIPIYKVEPLIERCVRSLMEQTMKESIEFLFINDATPDRSMEVLSRVIAEYPERKEQIRILHNPYNLGISETRKRGITEAHGKYIGWCDSDDWCEPDMFEKMWQGTQNGVIDIVICNSWTHLRCEDKEIRIECKYEASNTPQEAIQYFWKDCIWQSMPRTLWHHLSKKALISKAAASIHKTNYGEDTFMNIYCFYLASTARWLKLPLYHHDRMTLESSLSRREFCDKEEWKAERINIDRIEQLLSGDKKYITTIHYLQLTFKNVFHKTFDNSWHFWRTYHKCYKDICKLSHTSSQAKWKVYLIYNIFPLYWLMLKNKDSYFMR